MDVRFIDLFKKTLKLSESTTIQDFDSPESLSSWDSISHLNLIANAEEIFGVDIEPEEIPLMMKNINAFSSILSSKLNTSVC